MTTGTEEGSNFKLFRGGTETELDARDEDQAFYADGTRDICRKKLDWLIRCYRCAVNNYPQECCSPRPLPVPPGYHTNLDKRAEMAANSILPPTLKMILKRYYLLPVRQSPVLPHPENPSCPSSLPCTKPKSSGDDQTESGSLGAPVDGPKEEQS